MELIASLVISDLRKRRGSALHHQPKAEEKVDAKVRRHLLECNNHKPSSNNSSNNNNNKEE